MPGRWPSSPAHTLSSCGLLTRWAIGTVGLMLLWMQQQQRPGQGAGPLTRPRRPRRAVVRWLSLDSCWLWGYTGLATSHCFHTLSIAALGPAADAVERREKAPHRPCHPVGGFLASGALGGLWGKGPQWALPLLVHLAGGLMSRPAERPRRGLALASDRRSDTPPQRAYLRAPAARNAGKGPACGALAGGVQIAAPRRGKGCSSSPQPGPRLGWGAAPPARGPGPLRPPEGRGRRGGRPHSPHFVGAGPPRSTCAATGTGEEQCKAGPTARPAGAWPCIAEGCPRATAAAQLDRAGARRGPALGRTLPRPDPAGGWTGRAAARRPGWAGVRPAGRWGRVGRPRGPDGSPHHSPQAVAPFPVARSSCQRWGPGVGSDAAADSGPAAECSSTGASMGAPALWSGC